MISAIDRIKKAGTEYEMETKYIQFVNQMIHVKIF